jgi:hypothetical protein
MNVGVPQEAIVKNVTSELRNAGISSFHSRPLLRSHLELMVYLEPRSKGSGWKEV